ncbi:hypothetical protein [Chryseobacterium sp.]|uniref:hypothetical protein n=1 Tax=Chryseobacterium sp. TaxID=1871047 RepID=UPI00260E63E6|nr:hypothetical protein [Chryseobacterium sp.]
MTDLVLSADIKNEPRLFGEDDNFKNEKQKGRKITLEQVKELQEDIQSAILNF